jgi:hypothetical protein
VLGFNVEDDYFYCDEISGKMTNYVSALNKKINAIASHLGISFNEEECCITKEGK